MTLFSMGYVSLFRKWLAPILLLAAGNALAATDCDVSLNSAFTGEIGDGTPGEWLSFSYVQTTGSTVTSSGAIPLGSPMANAIMVTALAALTTGRVTVSLRFQNAENAELDAVCSTPRADLIGIVTYK